MDMARFERLEAHVVRLVEVYTLMKEDNNRLTQQVMELQAALQAQEQELAKLRPEHEELQTLRNVLEAMQQERHVIREKLEQMLVAIEWIEERTGADQTART